MEQTDDETKNPNALNNAIVAFRLTAVENGLGGVLAKLDNIIDHYPTKEELMQFYLEPLKDRVLQLEAASKQAEDQHKANRNQLKLTVIAAAVTPIISLIAAALVAIVIAGIHLQ